jgi:hypothetical protein
VDGGPFIYFRCLGMGCLLFTANASPNDQQHIPRPLPLPLQSVGRSLTFTPRKPPFDGNFGYLAQFVPVPVYMRTQPRRPLHVSFPTLGGRNVHACNTGLAAAVPSDCPTRACARTIRRLRPCLATRNLT